MKSLLLIDTYALIYRFFHALPPLTTPPPERAPVGALYGLSGTLLSILLERRPQFLAAALDRPEPTFRKEAFAAYKMHRPAAPNELISQLRQIPDLLSRFRVPTFSVPGFEADDIIGTLAEVGKRGEGIQVVILSGDHDVFQLVDGDCVVADIIRTGISDVVRFNEAAVVAKYGLVPSQLPDYKALVGDTSDNIPGIPGIGAKTATALLKEFGTLEGVFENIGIIPNTSAAKLEAGKEQVFTARRLATIVRTVPLAVSLEGLRAPEVPRGELAGYFQSLGFQSLVKRLGI